MILIRRKLSTDKKTISGQYNALLSSINETINNKINSLEIAFKCETGVFKMILPVNDKLHDTLCELAHLGGLTDNITISDFIGINVRIIIKDNQIVYVAKEL